MSFTRISCWTKWDLWYAIGVSRHNLIWHVRGLTLTIVWKCESKKYANIDLLLQAGITCDQANSGYSIDHLWTYRSLYEIGYHARTYFSVGGLETWTNVNTLWRVCVMISWLSYAANSIRLSRKMKTEDHKTLTFKRSFDFACFQLPSDLITRFADYWYEMYVCMYGLASPWLTGRAN